MHFDTGFGIARHQCVYLFSYTKHLIRLEIQNFVLSASRIYWRHQEVTSKHDTALIFAPSEAKKSQEAYVFGIRQMRIRPAVLYFVL